MFPKWTHSGTRNHSRLVKVRFRWKVIRPDTPYAEVDKVLTIISQLRVVIKGAPYVIMSLRSEHSSAGRRPEQTARPNKHRDEGRHCLPSSRFLFCRIQVWITHRCWRMSFCSVTVSGFTDEAGNEPSPGTSGPS